MRAGALLVKLNDADLRATLSRAQYRKQLAVLREKRIAQLLKQGVARQEEYDTALAELNVQDADIELTRAQIAKTEIRAPFDGIVGLRYVSDGAFINAATRVATLQRLDRLKIDFSLPEKYAGRIKPRSPVTFSVAGGDRRFKGEIYAHDPRIDAATRTVLVRAWCRKPGRTVVARRVRQRGAGAGGAAATPSWFLRWPSFRDSTRSMSSSSARSARRSGARSKPARGSRARCTSFRDSAGRRRHHLRTAADAARAADQVSIGD